LAHALFEIRRRHDLAELAGRQAHGTDRATRRLDGHVTDVQPVGVGTAGFQHELGAPAVAVFGYEAADRRVPARVTAARLEDPRDILHQELDPQGAGPLARELVTLW